MVWRTIHDFHVIRFTFKIIFEMKYFYRNYFFVSGDFNARVQNNSVSGAVGVFVEQHGSSNGNSFIRFGTSNNLKITNTLFREKDINKYTWSIRESRSIIEYVLPNKRLTSKFKMSMCTEVWTYNQIIIPLFLILSRLLDGRKRNLVLSRMTRY